MLKIKHIQAGYGRVPVLRGVDLSIPFGTVMALMGRNGMGKTTLCHVCNGLLAPTAGTVELDGELLTGRPAHQVARRGVATVPQGRDVFAAFTVAENLTLGLRGAKVPDEIYDWFPALAPLARRVAGTLSGGEQQMLAIGRALARRPKALLLDEPSEGLQPSVVHDIGEILAAVVNETGLAVLLVEQNIELVRRVAGTCAFLAAGVIAEEAPTARLTAEDGPLHRHLAL